MRLIDMDVKEAAEALAQRAAELRSRPPTVREKRAAGAADYLAGLGEHVRNNPVLAQTLLGGAAGAGLGGLGTWWGNRGRDDLERKSPLAGALTGGLAGAALGGGVGLARKHLGSLGPAHADPETPPGTFEEGGRRFHISPEAFRDPAVAARLRDAFRAQPPDPIDSAVSTTLGVGRSLANRLPGVAADVGSGVAGSIPLPAWLTAGGLGAADLAFHQRLAPLGRFGFGAVRDELTSKAKHLRLGLDELLKGKPEHPKAPAVSNLLGRPERLERLARRPNGGFRFLHTPTQEQQITRTDPNDPNYRQQFKQQQPGTPRRLDLSEGELGAAAASGLRQSLPPALEGEARLRQLGPRRLGLQWHRGSVPSRVKWLARAGVYPGILAAGYLLDNQDQGAAQQQQTGQGLRDELVRRGLVREEAAR